MPMRHLGHVSLVVKPPPSHLLQKLGAARIIWLDILGAIYIALNICMQYNRVMPKVFVCTIKARAHKSQGPQNKNSASIRQRNVVYEFFGYYGDYVAQHGTLMILAMDKIKVSITK